MKKLLVVLTFIFVLTLSACGGTTSDEHIVYTTVYPVQFIVEEIAGDYVTVKRVPGSTSGGHSDELNWTGKEIIDMINADLLFYVDAGVDNYISNSIDSVFSDGSVNLINMSEEIMYAEVCYSHDHDHGEEDHVEEHADEGTTEECEENLLSLDPHFWLSPDKMLDAALAIKNVLATTYPDQSDDLERNYLALKAELSMLDIGFETMSLSAVKPIITSSMIFNYFHTSYELEIIALSADAHNSEVVPGDVIEFVEEALFHEIHYVFFEYNTNSPSGDLVLQELQKQDVSAVGENLFSLANLTQEQVDAGETYLTLMEQNLDLLEEATK